MTTARLRRVLDRQSSSVSGSVGGGALFGGKSDQTLLREKLFNWFSGVLDRESWKMSFGNIHEIDADKYLWEQQLIESFVALLGKLNPQVSLCEMGIASPAHLPADTSLTTCQTTLEGKKSLLAGGTPDVAR